MSISFAISVAAGATVFLLLHVGIWRAVPANSPRMALLGLLVLVGIGASLALDFAVGGGGLELWAVAWTGASFGVFYIVFYTVLARSVSLTLLARMLQGGNRPIPLSDLIQEYTSSARFDDRIQLMHESGFTRRTADSVALTAKGARMARWAKGLSCVFGHGLEG